MYKNLNLNNNNNDDTSLRRCNFFDLWNQRISIESIESPQNTKALKMF